MSGIAVAIGGAAVLGIGATYLSSQAAKKGQEKAIDLQWKMFQQGRADYAPWRETGERALGTLEGDIAAGPGEFRPKDQPGYKFGFEEFIEDPYLSSQSARGKRLSGETVKGLTKYASDYAETSYDNFLKRYYDRLRPLQSLAGVGQTATQGTVQAGAQAGQNIGQGYQNMGDIQSQAIAGYGGVAQQGIQNYMNYMMMDKMGVFDTNRPQSNRTPGTWGG